MKQEPYRQYVNFKKLMKRIQENEIEYSRGRLKELRNVLKQGEVATRRYLRFHKIEDIGRDSYQDIYTEADNCGIGTGRKLERKIFLETTDGISRSVLFDVIEALDTFLELEY